MASIDLDRDDLFDFEDSFFSLMALNKYDSGMVAQLRENLKEDRRFCREVLAPYVLSEDRKHAEDHNYISWELLRLAGRHGRLTSFIPKFMGGQASGSLVTGMGPNMEETASVDGAFSGMLGGHGLGLVALMASFNMRVVVGVAEKTVAHQLDDKPYVIDCAITEPTAGTDVEEVELYPKARLMCQAKRVPGGAILNGRKVFISTGHMATDHVVLIPFDLKDPVNNYGCFLVPNGAKGFSLGRKERKMGQRAGPASELIFEDCFVPQESIVMDTAEFAEPRYQDQFKLLLETVLGVTRTAVGAWSTGTARAALERALALAKTQKHKGRTLIHQQWAQAMLTNMFMNVMMARSVYLESTFALMANMTGGLNQSMPGVLNNPVSKAVFQSGWFRKLLFSKPVRKVMLDQLLNMPAANNSRIQFMSSMAKVVGSDMAMENCQMAVEFLSQAGLRHDQGVEKVFRDAKLLQIFEGTNQLNRLNMFKHAFARHLPGVEVF
jgi:alkylation response protein AidB-like acyl-CoA dehydrogenase